MELLLTNRRHLNEGGRVFGEQLGEERATRGGRCGGAREQGAYGGGEAERGGGGG